MAGLFSLASGKTGVVVGVALIALSFVVRIWGRRVLRSLRGGGPEAG